MMVFWPEILLVYHSMIQRIIDVVHSERVPLKKFNNCPHSCPGNTRSPVWRESCREVFQSQVLMFSIV